MNIHEHETNEYSLRSNLANFNICTLTIMIKSNSVLGTNLVIIYSKLRVAVEASTIWLN